MQQANNRLIGKCTIKCIRYGHASTTIMDYYEIRGDTLTWINNWLTAMDVSNK